MALKRQLSLLSYKKNNFIPDTDLLHNDRFRSEPFISDPIASTISPPPELPGPLVVTVAEEHVRFPMM